jgi:hypothetical protein
VVSVQLVLWHALKYFFFLAEVAAFQGAQEAVASPSSREHIRIPRPAKIGNLRDAMRLRDDDGKYLVLRWLWLIVG